MLRIAPTRLRIDEADLADIFASTNSALQPRALGSPFHSPMLAPQTATVEDWLSTSTPKAANPVSPADLRGHTTNEMHSTPTLNPSPLPPLVPYTHLPYGPDREEILLSNLHLSHLHSTNAALATQSALARSALDQLSTAHNANINQLLTEIHTNQTQNMIENWRQTVFSLENEDNKATTPDLQQVSDLLQKYANLRAEPLVSLPAIQAAESASEPGRETDMNPPISTILGIQGGRNIPEGAPLLMTRLYGAEDDVRVVLEAEEGLLSMTNARAGPVGFTAGEEDAAVEDGAGLEIPVADAVSATGESGNMEEAGGVNDESLGAADADGAALVKATPRHRLLAKLKKIFRL